MSFFGRKPAASSANPSTQPGAILRMPSAVSPVVPSTGTLHTPANSSRPEISPRLMALCAQRKLRIHDRLVAGSEDMARVPFLATLNDELDLAPHLGASIAVVASNASKTEAILLIAETASSDIIDAVLARLQHRGIALAQDGAQIWPCAAPVLMAVTGGDLQPQHTQVIRSRQQDSGQSALWQSFVTIVDWAVANNANDIDFRVFLAQMTSQVYFKIDGRYITLDRWQLPTETLVAMLGIAWQHSRGGSSSKFELRQEQQCRIDVTLHNGMQIRLRWASMSTDKGATITMRVQRLGSAQVVTTLEDAGFLPEQVEVFERTVVGKGGLTTLSGTVGSGKSVTLAILMGLLPPELKGVTFEDPVEIDIPWMHQKTISRDLIGDDDSGFQAAVRTLFRSALDIFVLGETRDVATGRVLRAVLESGHSGYTTTHAGSGVGIITKYASPQVGIPLEVLATPGMLRLNVYQALLLKNCSCALAPDDLSQVLDVQARARLALLLDDIHALYGVDPRVLRLRNPQGCPVCRRSDLSALWGYKGRTVVAEMMEPDETICDLVLKGDMGSVKRYWRSLSDQDVTSSAIAGKTAMEIAMYKALRGEIDPREIELHFDSFRSLASKAAADKRTEARRSSARLTVLGGGAAATDPLHAR